MSSRTETFLVLAGGALIGMICFEDLVLSVYELVEFGRLLLS